MGGEGVIVSDSQITTPSLKLGNPIPLAVDQFRNRVLMSDNRAHTGLSIKEFITGCWLVYRMSGKAKESSLVVAQSLTTQPGERPHHNIGTFQWICPAALTCSLIPMNPGSGHQNPRNSCSRKKQKPLQLCLPEESCGLCLMMLTFACQVWQGYICLAESMSNPY